MTNGASANKGHKNYIDELYLGERFTRDFCRNKSQVYLYDFIELV